MDKLRRVRQYGWVAGAGFLFLLFWYISVRTPLAGDDWGYALNGMNFNPFAKAWEFYFTWSGRYFSELWGFLIAPRKELWNILNPALFTGIYILIYQIVNPKRNELAVAGLILAMMLSVKDWVRMETYTWIMGTTYVIPLFLILLVIWIMKQILFQGRGVRPWHFIVLIVLNFYIGLTMENIAAVSILLNILMVLYAWFRRRDALGLAVCSLIVSVLAFVLLRGSPGATFRLQRDNQEWMALGLFGQIQANWQNFLTYTFTDNKVMMLLLSAVSSLALVHHLMEQAVVKNKDKLIFAVQLLILGIALVASCAPMLYVRTHWEGIRLLYDHQTLNSALIFCSVFYILYIVNLFTVLVVLAKDKAFLERMTYLMLAGTANLVMMASPIFGARSSLYTIYFIILLAALLLSEIEIRPAEQLILILICSGLCLTKAVSWKQKYTLVAEIQREREEILQYYREHPEDDEAWIPRMPVMSVHSADIEEGDDYHMQVFKEYFGLPETTKLQFYYKEKY